MIIDHNYQKKINYIYFKIIYYIKNMEDMNWDVVRFTICIILDVIAFIFSMKLTNYFSKNL